MLVGILWAVVGCGEAVEGAPIRANLADGQVLSGELRTSTLVLDTSVGRLQIPLEDVGEVVPTEAAELGAAEGKVTVWLRNGSEFVGRWADPELAVGIDVGGQTVDVDLPMAQLNRLQTRAGEVWTEGAAYRVRTLYGDDFLVDPEQTRIVLVNELGTFAPFLSECASARPVAEPSGDWRVELTNGTVLVGPLADDRILFALPLGPGEVTVHLDDFSWMERVWFAPSPPPPPVAPPPRATDPGWGSAAVAPAEARAPEGWFDNRMLQDVKDQQMLH